MKSKLFSHVAGRVNVRNLVAGLVLGLTITSPALANDTRAIMNSVNKAMRDAHRVASPRASIAEAQRIQKHYNGWTNRYGGSVTQMEQHNKLAKRHHWEQARRQREIAISNAHEAERRAQAALRYSARLLRSR